MGSAASRSPTRSRRRSRPATTSPRSRAGTTSPCSRRAPTRSSRSVRFVRGRESRGSTPHRVDDEARESLRPSAACRSPQARCGGHPGALSARSARGGRVGSYQSVGGRGQGAHPRGDVHRAAPGGRRRTWSCASTTPAPKTPDEHLSQALTDLLRSDLEREAEASGGDIRVERISIDWDEERRQTLLKGGCDVELRAVRSEGRQDRGDAPRFMFPEPDDDGTETPWKVPEVRLAHADVAHARREGSPRAPIQHELRAGAGVPLAGYRAEGPAGELLGDEGRPGVARLLGAPQRAGVRGRSQAGPQEQPRSPDFPPAARPRAKGRRREAPGADGRRGHLPAELAALVPEIDLDLDRISLQVLYPSRGCGSHPSTR